MKRSRLRNGMRKQRRRRRGAAGTKAADCEPAWDQDLPREVAQIEQAQLELIRALMSGGGSMATGAERLPDGTKRISLSREGVLFMRLQRQLFRAVFEREPAARDPIFWDRSRESEGAVPMDPGRDLEMREALESSMLRAGMSPELAYAARKTGMILTKQNRHLMSDEELREWQKAIDEYKRIE
jgi:hypothetical protein